MNAPFKGGLVATVVAPHGHPLSSPFLLELADHLETNAITWLDQGVAADIFFTKFSVQAAYVKLKNHIADKPLDVLIQPLLSRRKRLLMADMESTIIQQEMLDELADLIGHREEVAAITRRAMNGELDFANALRERAVLLKDQTDILLNKAAQRITYMPGAVALVSAMKKRSAICWLVSGGFNCFVRPVAGRLGFDVSYANELVVRNGKITGEVIDPILDKNTKKKLLEKACTGLKVSLADTLAVGDGANDVPMLAACNEGGGLGVAYYAKPVVRVAIPHQINYTDLTTLLYAQGYSQQEITSSCRR